MPFTLLHDLVDTKIDGTDGRLTNARTPTAHAASHQGGADSLAVDAAAGTGSLRTLGTGATQACAGNDSRLTPLARGGTPGAHAGSHQPLGSDPMTVNAAAGVGSLRTLGTAALTACAGNDARLTPSGASGSFLSVDLKTVTVVNGVVTSIV